ncbi:hypothetical protein M1105_09950 [Limibaculum sp. FT325]|uniref:hypothetical protein n=1 Tax=Thermohalobaculum sediminis TaxID=2939436 RepID=UPI0020BF44E6|nr:hypothetical protein [Limibaculum sediminis]MCL5777308.1 hypothetical protein [Limibaculum sediminis]
MRDTERPPPDDGPGDEPEDVIVIVQVRNNFWLLEGEEYLGAMLSGQKPYPTPVRCLKFETEIEFKLHLPDCVPLGELWGINPLIVERLRKQRHLLEITPPE